MSQTREKPKPKRRRRRISLWQGVVLGAFIILDIIIIGFIVNLLTSAPAAPLPQDGNPPGLISTEEADPNVDYCNSVNQAICGDGCCNFNVENSDICPRDCPCVDDGVCQPGEGKVCGDCRTDGDAPTIDDPDATIPLETEPTDDAPAQGGDDAGQAAPTNPAPTSDGQPDPTDDVDGGRTTPPDTEDSDQPPPTREPTATPDESDPYGYGSSMGWDDPFVADLEARSEGRGMALTLASGLLTMSVLGMGAFLMVIGHKER